MPTRDGSHRLARSSKRSTQVQALSPTRRVVSAWRSVSSKLPCAVPVMLLSCSERAVRRAQSTHEAGAARGRERVKWEQAGRQPAATVTDASFAQSSDDPRGREVLSMEQVVHWGNCWLMVSTSTSTSTPHAVSPRPPRMTSVLSCGSETNSTCFSKKQAMHQSPAPAVLFSVSVRSLENTAWLPRSSVSSAQATSVRSWKRSP